MGEGGSEMLIGIRTRACAAWAIAMGLAVIGGATAAAREDAVLAVAYGNGVHAYYAGDYHRSYDQLTAAIEGGTRDPRAFYFRGLAELKLGRVDEAEADFSTGADREAAEAGNWPVARSLERIQGEPRLQLEKHRVRARLVAMEQRRQAVLRRYSEVEAVRPDVQRIRRPETVPAEPSRKSPAVAPIQDDTNTDETAAEKSPSEEPMEEAGATAQEEPADSPVNGDDPFGN